MPVEWKEIQQICALCHGTGKIRPSYNIVESPPAEIDCPQCDGEGYKEIGRIKV